MASNLNNTERSRFKASAVEWLSVEDGLSAFGAARHSDLPLVVLTRLNLKISSAITQEDSFPSLLRTIFRVPAESDENFAGFSTDSLPSRWARLLGNEPTDRKLQMLTNLVRTQAAQILGHSDDLFIESNRTFRDLGFDSLSAVRIRNSLNAAFGLRLPSTLVFDHPTPRDVAEQLLVQLTSEEEPSLSIFSDLERVKSAVLETHLDEEAIVRLTEALQDLTLDLYRMQRSGADAEPTTGDNGASESKDEIFDYIDKELGKE